VDSVGAVRLPSVDLNIKDTDLGKALNKLGSQLEGAQDALKKLGDKLQSCAAGAGPKVVVNCVTAFAAELRTCDTAKVMQGLNGKFNGGVMQGRQFGEEHMVEAGFAVVAGGLTGGSGFIAWLAAELSDQMRQMQRNAQRDPGGGACSARLYSDARFTSPACTRVYLQTCTANCKPVALHSLCFG
jgi:hypothetical protein